MPRQARNAAPGGTAPRPVRAFRYSLEARLAFAASRRGRAPLRTFLRGPTPGAAANLLESAPRAPGEPDRADPFAFRARGVWRSWSSLGKRKPLEKIQDRLLENVELSREEMVGFRNLNDLPRIPHEFSQEIRRAEPVFFSHHE